MKTAELVSKLEQETEKIWLEEPEEIRRMRLGIFPSGAGSYDQFFSNLVFINGDMRALSTWITPTIVMNAVDDESFTLDQAKSIFSWANDVFVDFLAYCGFVTYAELSKEVSETEVESKEEFKQILVAWYGYANRMYLWVHQVFPWGLGAAFPKLAADDLAFMQQELQNTQVADYFEANMPEGLVIPPPAPEF